MEPYRGQVPFGMSVRHDPYLLRHFRDQAGQRSARISFCRCSGLCVVALVPEWRRGRRRRRAFSRPSQQDGRRTWLGPLRIRGAPPRPAAAQRRAAAAAAEPSIPTSIRPAEARVVVIWLSSPSPGFPFPLRPGQHRLPERPITRFRPRTDVRQRPTVPARQGERPRLRQGRRQRPNMRPGDVIVSLGGHAVTSAAEQGPTAAQGGN